MSNKKVTHLLSSEYLMIRDLREVLSLNNIDLGIESILNWIEQSNELYIQPIDWNNFNIYINNPNVTFIKIQNYTKVHLDEPSKSELTSIARKSIYSPENMTNEYFQRSSKFRITSITVNDVRYLSNFSVDTSRDATNFKNRNYEYNDLANLFYVKSSFIKEYLSSLEDTATNQDDSYKYSEALKPYNDIILTFDSEYQLYKDKTKASSIDDWLETSYPIPNYSRDEHRVLKKLIKTHYKLKK